MRIMTAVTARSPMLRAVAPCDLRTHCCIPSFIAFAWPLCVEGPVPATIVEAITPTVRATVVGVAWIATATVVVASVAAEGIEVVAPAGCC